MKINFCLYFTCYIETNRCNIDAFVVVVRDVNELKSDSHIDQNQIVQNLRKYHEKFQPNEKINDTNRKSYIFIEIIVRFQKQFKTETNDEWNVSRFKVLKFQIINA